MKEFFPRQEFQRLGLSEPAIRLLERLTDIKEIGLRAAAMEEGLGKVARLVMDTDTGAVAAATASATASMSDIATVTISADYTGVVETGQLPRNVPVKRYAGSEDVTAETLWSASTDSGMITYTIGAATGILNITAIASSSVVTITSFHNGVSLSKKANITKQVASPPSSGSGGGTSASDSAFASFNSTTMATVSDVLTVTTGSVGTVTLSAPLSVVTAAAAPTALGGLDVKGRWQREIAAVWTDIGSEISSGPDCIVYIEEGSYVAEPGYIDMSLADTGLAASTSYNYRLQFKNDSGTRTMYLSGTAAAVGS